MAPDPSPERREFVLRCREPFSIGAAVEVRSTASRDDADGTAAGVSIAGIASSTSVDSHGTEMSADALNRMAEQMRRGIPLLPRHNNGTRAVEWDEVIGRTMDAVVERADVAAPGEVTEPGYRLRLTSQLYDDDPLSKRLIHRLERGEPIGQSIGGWFLSVRVVEADDGTVERVIVEDVELDHVALTRAPSNPDSMGLASVRSRIVAMHSQAKEPIMDTPSPERANLAERHIIAVDETETEYVVRYAKAMPMDDDDDRGMHDDEDSDRGMHGDKEDERSYHDDDDRMMDDDDRMMDGDDDRMMDEDEDRATPESVSEGDFVSFMLTPADDESEGGERYGQVVEVVVEGSVAGSPVEASAEDPLLRIDVFEPVRDGFEATGDIMVQPVSKVEKIDALNAPSAEADVDGMADAPVEEDRAEASQPDERAVPDMVDYPLAPMDTEWSWDAEAANEVLGDPPDWTRFGSVHLYMDPERAEVRDGYKLPVAKVIDGEIHFVFRGLAAAVAALNGARGGVDLPDADRQAAYDRAVELYERFDAEAPPLRSMDDESDDRSSPDQVDVRAISVHDTGEASPAARSASPTSHPTSEEESPMTPSDLAAIRSMIREEVGRAKVAEPQSAPPSDATVNPAAEPTAVEAELAQLRSAVARLSKEPMRRGLAYQTTRTSGRSKVAGPMGALVERARTEAPAVAVTVERAVESLDDKAATPRELIDGLAAVLRSAEGEGLLGNPNPARWA